MNKDGRTENLVPLAERTEEERKAIARKGGKAKAENQRHRKQVADTFNAILNLEYDEPTEYRIERHNGSNGILDEKSYWIELQGQTLLTRLCAEVVKKAMKGDIRSAELIFKYIEPPTRGEAESQI